MCDRACMISLSVIFLISSCALCKYHRYIRCTMAPLSLRGEARRDFSHAVQAKEQSSAFHDRARMMIRIHQISFDEVYDASRGSCVD